MSYYGEPNSPAVQKLHAPQSTEAAAAEAVKEQSYGDEFKPYKSPDVDALVARLSELETEQSRICQKLYGVHTFDGEYNGPPYLERERLHRELNKVEEEISSIKDELCNYANASGMGSAYGTEFAAFG